MTLKDRIIRVLNSRNVTYSMLANEIGISEIELDEFIMEKSSTKIFENISKLLGIPLYSFYREKEDEDWIYKKTHYKEDIWKD